MRRADRLFRLVQLLRARRFATGEQIADELGVSKRTIYRDVADLQGSGVPIRGEAGVGYRLERGYELAPLIFTSDELAGLVLGARIVAAWGDPDLASAVATAMTKVEAVLPEGLRRVVLDTPLSARSANGAWSTSATAARTAPRPCATRVRSASTSGDASGRSPPGASCAATTGASVPIV
jgi:predicted DNA-binding transcriptional regulator YafY